MAKPAQTMFQKIAFTMFQVEDATRARAFYEGVFGFERGLASPDGVWTEYDLPGSGCLALFMHPAAGEKRAGGSASVAFEVADLDALDERLKAAGVRYQGERVHGPNCRMSNILDSEGNSIVLHQLNAKPAKPKLTTLTPSPRKPAKKKAKPATRAAGSRRGRRG